MLTPTPMPTPTSTHTLALDFAGLAGTCQDTLPDYIEGNWIFRDVPGLAGMGLGGEGGIRTSQLLPHRKTKLIYLRAAFIFSSIPAPGHSSFSPSLLNGVSTVLRWAWRSSELVSRYSRPVTTSPLAAWWATYSSA